MTANMFTVSTQQLFFALHKKKQKTQLTSESTSLDKEPWLPGDSLFPPYSVLMIPFVMISWPNVTTMMNKPILN